MSDRARRIALLGGRLLLGGFLLAGGLGLALHGRGRQVARYRVPDAALAALAWSEVGAAALFIFPRTALAGAAALGLTLLAAISIHLRVGERPWALLLFLVLTAVLGGLSRPRRAGGGGKA